MIIEPTTNKQLKLRMVATKFFWHENDVFCCEYDVLGINMTFFGVNMKNILIQRNVFMNNVILFKYARLNLPDDF